MMPRVSGCHSISLFNITLSTPRTRSLSIDPNGSLLAFDAIRREERQILAAVMVDQILQRAQIQDRRQTQRCEKSVVARVRVAGAVDVFVNAGEVEWRHEH